MVVLGASNVARGLTSLLDIARRVYGPGLDLMVAAGHGRSFGANSSIPFRTLPGVVHSPLWKHLDERPPLPLSALITDVGNDILYEHPVADIAGWVESCLARLRTHGAEIILTRLPLENIPRLSPFWFVVMRTIFFPGCFMPLAEVLRRARELDERVVALGKEYDARVVEPDLGWYGADPLHVRGRSYPDAWERILTTADRPLTGAPRRRTWGHWLYVRTRIPAHVWYGPFEFHGRQPVCPLADGGELSLY